MYVFTATSAPYMLFGLRFSSVAMLALVVVAETLLVYVNIKLIRAFNNHYENIDRKEKDHRAPPPPAYTEFAIPPPVNPNFSSDQTSESLIQHPWRQLHS